jgi:hypothetical protein
MAISDNIDAKMAAIEEERLANEADPTLPTPISKEVAAKAIKAILGGTQDWIAYVSLFKATDAELARLVPTDGTTDDDRQEARAYLARNGVCGMGTGRHLKDNVTVRLD